MLAEKAGIQGIGKPCHRNSEKEAEKDIAFLADTQLVFVVYLLFMAIAECSAQEPAEMPALELPGRTFLLAGTPRQLPAWLLLHCPSSLVDKKEIDVFFNMLGDCSPSLLIAVDCLDGNSQKFCHLFLGFSQIFSNLLELFFCQNQNPVVSIALVSCQWRLPYFHTFHILQEP